MEQTSLFAKTSVRREARTQSFNRKLKLKHCSNDASSQDGLMYRSAVLADIHRQLTSDIIRVRLSLERQADQGIIQPREVEEHFRLAVQELQVEVTSQIRRRVVELLEMSGDARLGNGLEEYLGNIRLRGEVALEGVPDTRDNRNQWRPGKRDRLVDSLRYRAVLAGQSTLQSHLPKIEEESLNEQFNELHINDKHGHMPQSLQEDSHTENVENVVVDVQNDRHIEAAEVNGAVRDEEEIANNIDCVNDKPRSGNGNGLRRRARRFFGQILSCRSAEDVMH